MTILITGATGFIGGRVAQLLHEKGAVLRRLARDSAKAPSLADVPVVAGDYGDRKALDKAMIGIDTVFLVSAGAAPLARAHLHGNVIDAAAAAGVKRLVYLSFQGASATSPFPYSADHLLTEAHLKQSGIAWTILRDSFYLDLLPDLLSADNDKGGFVVRSPDAGGKVAWVAREDVVQTAANVLLDDRHIGHTYNLTGPEALSLAEATAQLAALTGGDNSGGLRYVNETIEEGRAWRAATGAAAWEVDVWLGSYLAMGTGELSRVSGDVAAITGRTPLSLKDYFTKHAELLAHFANSTKHA